MEDPFFYSEFAFGAIIGTMLLVANSHFSKCPREEIHTNLPKRVQNSFFMKESLPRPTFLKFTLQPKLLYEALSVEQQDRNTMDHSLLT